MFVALALVSGWLPAQDPPAVQEPETGREVRSLEPSRNRPGAPRGQIAGDGWPILDWRHATGGWGGLRDWLNEHGVDLEVFLITDGSVVASGGVHSGGAALRSLLDATVAIDGGRLLGWHGARFFADFQVQRGTNGSTDVGDLQGFSNIDSDDRSQLALLWYEQDLFDGMLRVKVGKANANTDFAYVEHGLGFINSSFGYSPTILSFPTYPDPAFGAAALVRFGGGLYAGAGVYDGAVQQGFKTGQRGPGTLFGDPPDLFLIGEVGRRWKGEEGAGPGRIGLGAFRHTGRFARYDGGTEHGTWGVYLVLDQVLWRPADAGESYRGLGGFLQYGWADPDVSPIEHHLGLGVTWTGPLALRPDDAVGLGLTWVSFSDAPGTGRRGSGELAVELFYTLQIAPWLRIKPDLQFIHNPGGLPGVDDALVLSLRTAITF